MASLEDAAREFVDELTQTIQGVLGSGAGRFVAVRAPKAKNRGRSTRVVVRTARSKAIPISIDAVASLELVADFRCQWDHKETYLAVHKASWAVRPLGVGEPLFRYEFEAGMKSRLPCAHLHVHAHRDEFVYQLFRGSKGRPKTRAGALNGGAGALPRLSNLHFPLGGPRMRPSLEDLLEFLREEFRIDVEPGYLDALNDGRRRWRRRQIGASVRDAPETAAEVLRQLGYDVSPPTAGAAVERDHKLTAP